MPKSARFLGFSGLLPTLGAVLVAIFHDARDIQLFATAIGLLYGGVILSFIGGAWWGLAAPHTTGIALTRILTLSVIPSLYAWGAVALAWILADYAFASFLLSLGFASTLPIDRWLMGQDLAPPWWMTLRVPLSVAMALLYLALAAKAFI